MERIFSVMLLLICMLTFFGCELITPEVKEEKEVEIIEEPDTDYSAAVKDMGDYYLIGGDMIFDKETPWHMEYVNRLLYGDRQTEGNSRSVSKTGRKFWPNGIVQFSIDPDFSISVNSKIKECLRYLETICDITFIETTETGNYIYDFIYVSPEDEEEELDGAAGKSTLGYAKKSHCKLPKNPLKSTILHEVLHGLGFEHEHQRHDRNLYIRIMWSNIIESNKECFYLISDEDSNEIGPYDYLSIMHYSATAAAIDPKKPTIRAVQYDKYQDKLGKSGSLSLGDIDGLKQVYDVSSNKPHFAVGTFRGEKNENLLFYDHSKMKWRVFRKNGSTRAQNWSGITYIKNSQRTDTGDFNGDGKDDIAFYIPGEGWGVSLSDGESFGGNDFEVNKWSSLLCDNMDIHLVGDFCGDDKDDILLIDSDAPYIPWVILQSTGTSFVQRLVFNTKEIYKKKALVGNFKIESGDDQKDELVICINGEGWEVNTFSDPSTPFPVVMPLLLVDKKIWTKAGAYDTMVGNFNGDDKDDLVQGIKGGWRVLLSNGSSFSSKTWSSAGRGECESIGDFNADGFDDILQYLPSKEKWRVISSTGSTFNQEYWLNDDIKRKGFFKVLIGDFNGDGADDFVQYHDPLWWRIFVSKAKPGSAETGFKHYYYGENVVEDMYDE